MGIFYLCVFFINTTGAALYRQNKIDLLYTCDFVYKFFPIPLRGISKCSVWLVLVVHRHGVFFFLHERVKKGKGVNVPS